jgi:hypothetical protein
MKNTLQKILVLSPLIFFIDFAGYVSRISGLEVTEILTPIRQAFYWGFAIAACYGVALGIDVLETYNENRYSQRFKPQGGSSEQKEKENGFSKFIKSTEKKEENK